MQEKQSETKPSAKLCHKFWSAHNPVDEDYSHNGSMLTRRPGITSTAINLKIPSLTYDTALSSHYDDVIMTTLASQITSLTVVYSIVYSGVNQRKHQSSASLAFVREIHRGPVNFPHKWPVTRKMFPFDDVIMCNHKTRRSEGPLFMEAIAYYFASIRNNVYIRNNNTPLAGFK